MKFTYKIEVGIYPNELEKNTPFFWCLMSRAGEAWCVENAGWEVTREAAWMAAYQFYAKYKRKDGEGVLYREYGIY